MLLSNRPTNQLDNFTNCHVNILFIGWILFIFISFPLIVFYIAFIGYYQDYPWIIVAYFAGAIVSILISIHAAFCWRFVQKMYQINVKIKRSISKLLSMDSKIKRETGNLVTQLLKLKQEKEHVFGDNVRLKFKLKQFSRWRHQITKNGINDEDQFDMNALYEIQEKLMKSIKESESEMMETEKLILINAYSSTLLRYSVDQLNVKQFASMLMIWPKRYRRAFIKSGKSFRDFNDDHQEQVTNYGIFNAFMNKSIIEQVRNGVELPGLSKK